MPRSRTDGRARAVRAAILAGARRTFLARGYARASMDAVAAAAGVSKMTVYRHFRSKEALFAGVVGEMCDRIADPGLAREMARLPLRRALETFGRRSLGIIFAPETLALHRLVIAEMGQFPELGRMFYDRGPAANIAMLAAYLRRRRGNGGRVGDAGAAAAEFMALLRGYEHMRALFGRAPSRRALERQLAGAVAHLLRRGR